MATRSVFVLATVLSIRDTFFYPSCTRCHKKVHSRDDEASLLWCEKCHEEYSAESVEYRYRISVVASDRTQLAQITVFGSCLDKFFGTSATNFARFVNGLKFDPLPIPWSHLLNQAVERCFVGFLLQFGFRVYSPRRTSSQVAHNSPFHLKNIVKKQGVSANKSCQPEGLPSLLACQIFPSSSSDQENPTVLQILNEYLEGLHTNTSQSFSLRISQGQNQHSPLIDHSSQTQASFKPSFATSCTSLQGNKASPMYCTPQEFCSMITPLVLTGSSQPFSGSIQMHETPPGFKMSDQHLHLGVKDQSGQVSSPNKGINSNNSNSLCLTQFTTPAGVRVFKKLDGCKELQAASYEWTEYDDFPSSEDLSAFLADLEIDPVNKEDGQTVPTPHSEKCYNRQPSVTSDEMTSGVVTSKNVTSETVSYNDVICRLYQNSVKEDYTAEFTDFSSTEDLDVFLADMELDCEHILMGKSLSPTAANNSIEIMAFSPDLFSQSLSRVEEVCYETPNLFSSPRLINGEARRSRCTKHSVTTPDLFSSSKSPCTPTHSCSRQDTNSVCLFSCSDHSHLSSSSPLSLSARSISFPISTENEADAQPIINHREVENKFVRNSQTVSFYSTPHNVNLSSKRLHKIWTPAGVSPLLSDFRGTSPCNEDISVQGSPILFSPFSSSTSCFSRPGDV